MSVLFLSAVEYKLSILPSSDPNESKNRVPLSSELTTLRGIRTQKQQLADILADQVKQAKEDHTRIQARYDVLTREMEALQSQLIISQDHIDILENQHRILQEEDTRLAGLLHPIRRCSEDVLRIVFDYATRVDDEDDHAGRKDSFKTASRISHVCKSWRTIALELSPLWNYLVISVKDDIGDVASFIERTKSRIRSSPVTFAIDIGDKPVKDTKKLIKTLRLDQFEAGSIYILLSSSKDIAHISEANFGTALASMHYLCVDCNSISGENPLWDCSWLLRQPKLNAVQLERLRVVAMTGADLFPSLITLHLVDICMPSMALHLTRFPNLQLLTITGDFEMDPLTRDISMASLNSLKVEDVAGFPWNRITAPQLTYIVTDDEDAIPFLCRHPSISSLKLNTILSEESFKSLALHLINVEILDIAGHIGGLFRQVSPEVPFPPFPRLEELSIQVGEEFTLSLEDVEDVVKMRCQPSQASENEEIALLSTWTINGEAKFLEHTAWRTSPLLSNFQQAFEKSGDEEPWCTLSLRWKGP